MKLATLFAVCAALAVTAFGGQASTVAQGVYSKARTLSGVCYGDDVFGTATVKVGKISNSSGKVKVSATIVPLSGKKLTASATLDADQEGVLSGELNFKSPIGTAYFTAWEGDSGALEFSLEAYEYTVVQCAIGGRFSATTLAFSVNGGDIDFGDGYYPIIDLPNGEPIYVKGGTKFSFNKAPSIKYKKAKGETYYELTGLDDTKKTNLSALKLSYNVKSGAYNGSFKIYASNEDSIDEGKMPKLKTYVAKVSGVVINGNGFGSASVKVGKDTYTFTADIIGSDSGLFEEHGEKISVNDVGAFAYANGDESGVPPDAYNGDDSLMNAFIDIFRR